MIFSHQHPCEKHTHPFTNLVCIKNQSGLWNSLWCFSRNDGDRFHADLLCFLMFLISAKSMEGSGTPLGLLLMGEHKMNEVCLVLDGRVKAGNGSGETDVVPSCSAQVPEPRPEKGFSVLHHAKEGQRRVDEVWTRGGLKGWEGWWLLELHKQFNTPAGKLLLVLSRQKHGRSLTASERSQIVLKVRFSFLSDCGDKLSVKNHNISNLIIWSRRAL